MIGLTYKTIERLTIGFTLFLFVGGLPFSIYLFDLESGQEVPDQTRLILRFTWLFAYIPTVILFLLRWREVITRLQSSPLLIILVTLPILSAVWSVLPIDTLRRAVGLLFTTLFGLVLATRCDRTELLSSLAWVLTIVMLASLLFGLVIPDWGKMEYNGELSWRGVFYHKNAMGEVMLLYVLVLCYLVPQYLVYRIYSVIGMLLALSLLYLSKSMTPVIVGLVLVAIAGIFRCMPRQGIFSAPWFVLSFLWLSFGILLVFYNLETILGFLGRDTSLTGRDVVWKLLWEQIQSHFLLGFGYQAFWLDEQGPAAGFWKILGWKMSSAHNGYLELWLDLGFVGILLFLVVFSKKVLQSLSFAIRESSWPLMFLMFFLLLNLSESRILEQNNLYWVLFVAISGQLDKASNLHSPLHGSHSHLVDVDSHRSRAQNV